MNIEKNTVRIIKPNNRALCMYLNVAEGEDTLVVATFSMVPIVVYFLP